MFRYSSIVDTLLKAMTHKYIRRVPKGVTKTGKTKYMYFYAGQEGHGRGIAHESELVEGSSFAFGEHGKTRYHAHISKVDGDKVTVRYDDGAKKDTEETMTKKQFQALVHGEHATGIKQAKEKAEKQLQDFKAGKEKGVKVKQETLDKLEQRVKNLDELSKPVEAAKKMPDKATRSKEGTIKPSEQKAGALIKTLEPFIRSSNLKKFQAITINPENGGTICATDAFHAVIVEKPQGFKFGNDLGTETVCIPSTDLRNMKKTKDAQILLHANNTDQELGAQNSNIISYVKEQIAKTKEQKTLNITDDFRNQIVSLDAPEFSKIVFKRTDKNDLNFEVFIKSKDYSDDLQKITDVRLNTGSDRDTVKEISFDLKRFQNMMPLMSKMYFPEPNKSGLASNIASFEGIDANTSGILMESRR